MKKNALTLFAMLLAGVVLVFVGCQKENLRTEEALEELQEQGKLITFNSEVIPDKYVVVFKSSSVKHATAGIASYSDQQKAIANEADRILANSKIQKRTLDQVYAATIHGVALTLSEKEVAQLATNPDVKYIAQDRTISIQGGPPGGGGGGGGGSTETVPCGITVVGGGATYTGTKKIYILDSGIDLDHPDLNVDEASGFNAFSSGRDGKSLDDGNGHGTHCAGTAAAIGGNNQGVVGVAAGAPVVPVKVLGSNGSGSYSGVVAGVDFVGANGSNGDVANMSLGGPVYQPLDAAVVAAAGNGIKFTLAAGNESDDANNHSPARANGPNVYTISAMNCSGNWASFSNYGSPVDYCAPGVSVYSTYKGGGYATLSGTSMAAPHAAGVLLLGNPSSCGTVSGDPDGNPDPIICL